MPDPAPPSLSDRLRAAIRSSGLSSYEIGYRRCRPQLDPSLIGRFVEGERSQTLKSADSLARALGLMLAARREEEGRHGGRPSRSAVQPDT